MGLTQEYRNREDVKHFCGMLDGLAFLPPDDVDEGMSYVSAKMPDVPGLEALVDYFSATYVYGVARPVRRPHGGQQLILRVRQLPPLFPRQMWNVHEATLKNEERTNNVCEGWNHAFAWSVKRAVRDHQRRLQQLCADLRDGRKTAATVVRPSHKYCQCCGIAFDCMCDCSEHLPLARDI